MQYILGDIFVGNFPITQSFGADAARYNALYGLKGHNGQDYGCPTGTMILSAADGVVTEIGVEELGTFDSAGYGRYVKIVHNGYFTLYAHLNDITVKVGDHVVSGQLIAHSNNTGNSTGPHLHFGVAPCDANGAKTERNNGFGGYIDPMGEKCHWEVKNLSAPVVPGGNDEEQTIPVKSSDFTTLVSQATNYKIIADYLVSKGMNGYLAANGRTMIDFNANPTDPVGGESCTIFLSELFRSVVDLQNLVTEMRNNPQSVQITSDNIASQIETLPQDKKATLLTSLLAKVKSFVFEGSK